MTADLLIALLAVNALHLALDLARWLARRPRPPKKLALGPHGRPYL